MAEVRLTPAAQRDLEGIFDYTVERWGLEQALRYTEAIAGACALLAEQPDHGLACDAIRSGYRSWRVERHRIYYRPAPYGVAVVRVLHERMDVPRHLR